MAINTSGLPVLQKLAKGQTIITRSTNNPNVPGNAPLLAVVSTAQAALAAAQAAVEANRTLAKQLIADRDTAEAAWDLAIGGLAGFTDSATDGSPDKILTTGYDVKSAPVPPQPVAQVANVRVSFNGTPGYSDVRWDRQPQSDAYMVQCCQDPISEAGWKNMGTVRDAKFTGNGATPGQRCWYRVAGVNRLGAGPWSEPALRPVM